MCSDIGHRVAESALCYFAGGVVDEHDGCCVFWEGVDGIDFFGAVDRVGDRRDEVASWEERECEECCEDGDWFDHVWSIILWVVCGEQGVEW